MRKFILFLGAIVAGLGVGYGASRYMQPKAAKVVRSVAAAPSTARPASAALIHQDENRTSLPARPVNPVFAQAIEVRGYIVRGARVNVLLSDGTVLTERDPELQNVERNSVTILGKKYAIKAPSREVAAGAQTVGGAAGRSASLIFGGGGAQPPEGASETGGRREAADVVCPPPKDESRESVYVTGPDGVSRIIQPPTLGSDTDGVRPIPVTRSNGGNNRTTTGGRY